MSERNELSAAIIAIDTDYDHDFGDLARPPVSRPDYLAGALLHRGWRKEPEPEPQRSATGRADPVRITTTSQEVTPS